MNHPLNGSTNHNHVNDPHTTLQFSSEQRYPGIPNCMTRIPVLLHMGQLITLFITLTPHDQLLIDARAIVQEE
jgi:hypothetical protein